MLILLHAGLGSDGRSAGDSHQHWNVLSTNLRVDEPGKVSSMDAIPHLQFVSRSL